MAAEQLLGALPRGWEYVTLGEACARGGGGVQTGPFGTQLHASDYVAHGIPSIMPQNIGDNRVVHSGIACITPEDAERLARYRVRLGDIVYSRRGDVERRALIRQEEDGWLCGTGCLRVRVGDGQVDSRYVSYYLGDSRVREWIVRHAHGATMANLNTGILSALPLVVPPPSAQAAIAHILGTLDDKIELNRRMNETLGSIARALFHSWFVDFDPVRAKAAGTATFRGVPKALFDQLPSQLAETNLGVVPTGWEHVPIGDLVEVVGGSTPSTTKPEFWEGGKHPFCTPKDMSGLTSPVLLHTERHLTQAGVNMISSGQLPVGTVILSSRAPIGYLALAETPLSVNQGIIAMLTGNVPNTYVLLWAEASMAAIKSQAGGSTFAEISKGNFRPIPVLRPDEPTLTAFGDITKSLFARIAANERESGVLAAIRDALLPKLISGQIRGPGSEGADHGH